MASSSPSISSHIKLALLLGLAADAILAYILARLLLDTEPTLDIWGAYLLFVVAAQWIVGTWSWLKRNGFLWFSGKDSARKMLLDQLRQNKLPPPGSQHSARFDYLEAIANDPRYDPDDRVKAAIIHTAMLAAMTKGGIVSSMMMGEAFDSAVKDYNIETPDNFCP